MYSLQSEKSQRMLLEARGDVLGDKEVVDTLSRKGQDFACQLIWRCNAITLHDRAMLANRYVLRVKNSCEATEILDIHWLCKVAILLWTF